MSKLDSTLAWLFFFVSTTGAAYLADMPHNMFMRFMCMWFAIVMATAGVLMLAFIIGIWYRQKLKEMR